MKTEILKSYSSFGVDCELSRITFDHSSLVEYQVSVRFCVAPKDWDSCYQVCAFGDNEVLANDCFKKYIREFI